MTTSEQVHEIAAALAKAQGEMEGATKSAANPFFKSKYADLASVREACMGPLSKHGIAVLQSPSAEGAVVSVETMLVHSSGQWIRGVVTVTAKDDSPQAIGSCITYCRRYALQSFAGVAPEDDDGEAAQGRSKSAAKPTVDVPTGYDDWLLDLSAVVPEGTAALQSAWKQSKPEYRAHLTATNAKGWELMKKAAANVRESVAS
jgi:hypothetical protein